MGRARDARSDERVRRVVGSLFVSLGGGGNATSPPGVSRPPRWTTTRCRRAQADTDPAFARGLTPPSARNAPRAHDAGPHARSRPRGVRAPRGRARRARGAVRALRRPPRVARPRRDPQRHRDRRRGGSLAIRRDRGPRARARPRRYARRARRGGTTTPARDGGASNPASTTPQRRAPSLPEPPPPQRGGRPPLRENTSPDRTKGRANERWTRIRPVGSLRFPPKVFARR